MSAAYTEHKRTEAHGFEIVAATFSDSCRQSGDLIWLGGLYSEGRWLTADEAEVLAGALFGAAAVHRTRRVEVPA